jgi:hypothetical protein
LPASTVVDVLIAAISHLALMSAVALLATIAALYLMTQPLQIPLLTAVGIALGMHLLASATRGRAALYAVVLMVGSLCLAQLLFWCIRLSSQIGAPLTEALKRLTLDFLWVLSTVELEVSDWVKLAFALLVTAALSSWPWRTPAQQ